MLRKPDKAPYTPRGFKNATTNPGRARRREENAAWRAYHLEQALRLEAVAAELAASHRARAAMLGEVS